MSQTKGSKVTNRATSANDLIANPNATVVLTEQQVRELTSSNEHTTDAPEAAVRRLAHRKWEAAGCPAGDGVEFWLEAEREVNAEQDVLSRTQD